MFKVGDKVIMTKYGFGIVVDVVPPAYFPPDVVYVKDKDGKKHWLYIDLVKYDNQYQRKLKLQEICSK